MLGFTLLQVLLFQAQETPTVDLKVTVFFPYYPFVFLAALPLPQHILLFPVLSLPLKCC